MTDERWPDGRLAAIHPVVPEQGASSVRSGSPLNGEVVKLEIGRHGVTAEPQSAVMSCVACAKTKALRPSIPRRDVGGPGLGVRLAICSPRSLENAAPDGSS